MENMNKEVLEDVFLNVRKAYRLLFEYQSKVLNLAKYIGNYFSYNYQGGWPLFSNPAPNSGKGYLDNWAWDWLNMYAYAFHFGQKSMEKDNIKDNITFEMQIYSDTGFYDIDPPAEHNQKIKTETFKNEEESKTKLVLVASSCGWEKDKLYGNFNSRQSTYEIKTDKLNMCAKAYNLEDFIDEENTNEQLKDFAKFCAKKGIKIKD